MSPILISPSPPRPVVDGSTGTARVHLLTRRSDRHPCAMSMHVGVGCLERHLIVTAFVRTKSASIDEPWRTLRRENNRRLNRYRRREI